MPSQATASIAAPAATPLRVAVLAATLRLGAADGRAQLLPFGEFEARDGRPGRGVKWRLDDAGGQRLAAELNRVAAATPIVIDYEHQTALAASNGQAAPAAGWIKRVQWLAGQGLFAEVEWTSRASAYIQAGEYRYISPVITYDEGSGRVVGLLNAALVNYPAVLGMEAVQAALAGMCTPTQPGRQPGGEPEPRMDLTKLLEALGLAADANEAAALAEIARLKAQPTISAELCAALGVQAGAPAAALLSAAQQIKGAAAAAGAADTAVAALTTQVAQLSARLACSEVDKLVEQGTADGKLLPATEPWFRELARRDIEQARAYLKAAPAIAQALGQQQSAQGAKGGQGGGTAALSGEAANVVRLLGITPDAFNKAAAA